MSNLSNSTAPSPLSPVALKECVFKAKESLGINEISTISKQNNLAEFLKGDSFIFCGNSVQVHPEMKHKYLRNLGK